MYSTSYREAKLVPPAVCEEDVLVFWEERLVDKVIATTLQGYTEMVDHKAGAGLVWAWG